MKASKSLLSVTVFAVLSATTLTPDAVALAAMDEWNAAARAALPIQIKLWLGAMMLTNVAAIAFLKNHIAARWVFGGFVISHVLVMVMWASGQTVFAGQVSLFHILFWTPGAIVLLRRRQEIDHVSAYAVWAALSLIFYFGSMIVDVRDAFSFVQNMLT